MARTIVGMTMGDTKKNSSIRRPRNRPRVRPIAAAVPSTVDSTMVTKAMRRESSVGSTHWRALK